MGEFFSPNYGDRLQGCRAVRLQTDPPCTIIQFWRAYAEL